MFCFSSSSFHPPKMLHVFLVHDVYQSHPFHLSTKHRYHFASNTLSRNTRLEEHAYSPLPLKVNALNFMFCFSPSVSFGSSTLFSCIVYINIIVAVFLLTSVINSLLALIQNSSCPLRQHVSSPLLPPKRGSSFSCSGFRSSLPEHYTFLMHSLYKPLRHLFSVPSTQSALYIFQRGSTIPFMSPLLSSTRNAYTYPYVSFLSLSPQHCTIVSCTA